MILGIQGRDIVVEKFCQLKQEFQFHKYDCTIYILCYDTIS